MIEETGLTAKEVKDGLKRLEFYGIIHKRTGGAAGKKSTFIRLDCAYGDASIAGRDAFVFPSSIAEKVEQARHGIWKLTQVKAPFPSGGNTPTDTPLTGGKVPHGTIQKFHTELSNTEVSFSEVTEVQDTGHPALNSMIPLTSKPNPNTLTPTPNPKEQTPTPDSPNPQKETNPELEGIKKKEWTEPGPQFIEYAYAAMLRVKEEWRAHFASEIKNEQKGKKPDKSFIVELQAKMDSVPVLLDDAERDRLKKMAGYATARYGDPVPFFDWLTFDTWDYAPHANADDEVRPNGRYLMAHRDVFFEAYEKSLPQASKSWGIDLDDVLTFDKWSKEEATKAEAKLKPKDTFVFPPNDNWY